MASRSEAGISFFTHLICVQTFGYIITYCFVYHSGLGKQLLIEMLVIESFKRKNKNAWLLDNGDLSFLFVFIAILIVFVIFFLLVPETGRKLGLICCVGQSVSMFRY